MKRTLFFLITLGIFFTTSTQEKNEPSALEIIQISGPQAFGKRFANNFFHADCNFVEYKMTITIIEKMGWSMRTPCKCLMHTPLKRLVKINYQDHPFINNERTKALYLQILLKVTENPMRDAHELLAVAKHNREYLVIETILNDLRIKHQLDAKLYKEYTDFIKNKK